MSFDAFLLRMQGPWWQSVLALLLLLASARGVGCWLLPRRRGEFIRLALGMAVLAWLYPWWWRNMPGWVGAVLLVPAARGVWDIPWRDLKRDWRLYLVLGLFGAATLGSAFLPPDGWDEQVYQTALFTRFPEGAGKTDNPYAAYPLLPHFFMMWVRSWGGWSLPRLAVWFLSLLLGGKLYLEAARRSKDPLFGAVAAAGVMLSPLALVLHREFFAEAFVALFALAGFLVLEDPEAKSDRREDGRRQLLAGVFAGACVAVKLTGFGALLMLAIFAAKRRNLGRFIAGAAVAALPFFIRPWVTFGNPFYPFGSAWWGGEKARAVENIYRMLGEYGPGKMAGAARGWFEVCFAAENLYEGVWGFGVLALTALMLFGLWHRRDKSAQVAFSALVVGYVFWAMTSQQGRFLYPLIFVGVLLLADNFPSFSERRIRAVVVLLPVVGTLLSWNRIYPNLKHHVIAWRAVPEARRDPGRYLAWKTNDPAYFNALKHMGRTPKKARVLQLCERRSLYVPRNCEHASPLFQEVRLTPVPGNATELWRGIKDFDYVLLGSTQDRVDQLKSYGQVEALLETQLSTLQRRGRIRLIPLPPGVPGQPLIEVVHEP